MWLLHGNWCTRMALSNELHLQAGVVCSRCCCKRKPLGIFPAHACIYWFSFGECRSPLIAPNSLQVTCLNAQRDRFWKQQRACAHIYSMIMKDGYTRISSFLAELTWCIGLRERFSMYFCVDIYASKMVSKKKLTNLQHKSYVGTMLEPLWNCARLYPQA